MQLTNWFTHLLLQMLSIYRFRQLLPYSFTYKTPLNIFDVLRSAHV